MQTQIDQIRTRCQQAIARAKELYNVDLSKTVIRFDLKGRCAGQAILRKGQTAMRFNSDMLDREAFDHVLNDTVPHEVAHLVCFLRPELGRNHDAGWQRVCRELGGSGATRHQEEVVYGKGRTYEYVTDRGHRVRLGDRHHSVILRGGSVRFRHGKGTVTQASPCFLVGVSGRSIGQAVQIQAGVQPLLVVKKAEAATPETNSRLRETSKAGRTREIMAHGYRNGWTYEQVIAEMMRVNGYTRQLARATFKNNRDRAGVPETFC